MKSKKAIKKSGKVSKGKGFGKVANKSGAQSAKAAPAMSKGKAKLVDLFGKSKKASKKC